METRLNQMGIWRDRVILANEIPLPETDRQARRVIDVYIKYRADAGTDLSEAVDEFIRESAYTWFNRLFALCCMEAREIIDEVIKQREAYGGHSLKHRRLAIQSPEICAGEEDLEDSFNPARAHSLRAGFRSRLTGKMDGQLIECAYARGR